MKKFYVSRRKNAERFSLIIKLYTNSRDEFENEEMEEEYEME